MRISSGTWIDQESELQANAFVESVLRGCSFKYERLYKDEDAWSTIYISCKLLLVNGSPDDYTSNLFSDATITMDFGLKAFVFMS